MTTPEYVVDKATKLRDDLTIDCTRSGMRFEVLKRDAEIDYWRAKSATAASRAARGPQLETKWRHLDAELAFVAACNSGGESMAPETVERIRAIAERTWLRTLDDRIGLSQDERARRCRAPAPPLPVVEHLLADKPEHWSTAPKRTSRSTETLALPDPGSRCTNTTTARSTTCASGRGTLTEEESATRSASMSCRRSSCCRGCPSRSI